jgi:predicted ATPase
VNLAARLESLAAPGTILVSDSTRSLTEGYFAFRPLGPARVKGITNPMSIYEVTGIGPLRHKLEVSARRGLVRFVGRRGEMEQLRTALEMAKAGHGQVVGVMGEPGVGKSRLFHEFKLASASGCLVLEGFGVSHGKSFPYLPLIDLLRTYFAIGVDDDERKRREKIAGKIVILDRSLEDTLPYLFSLFGVLEPDSALQHADPSMRRRRMFATVKRLLLRETLNQPLVIELEDLHWIDDETQGFLDGLVDSLASARLLLLANYRPECRHAWNGKSYFAQLRLDPLEPKSAGEMLDAILGEGRELQPLKRLILEKSEGTPFFIEEIVQSLTQRGILLRNGTVRLTKPVHEIHVPPTVEGVLAARVDRLAPDEKGILQTAAVIGRQFSVSVLERVTGASGEKLPRLLASLQAAEFVYEQPVSAEIDYVFKHSLTRDVAYESLLIERRAVLHERAAQAIEEMDRHRLEERYAELAHHYRHSHNVEKAVDYLSLAGQQAGQRSAHVQAVSHLRTALEVLGDLPASLERARRELALEAAIGAALMVNEGYGSLEANQKFVRAHELCQELATTDSLPEIMLGRWSFHEVRSEFEEATRLGEEFVALAEGIGDPTLLSAPHWTRGDTLFFLGEFARASEHLESGSSLYDPSRDSARLFLLAQDPSVACLSFLGWIQVYLGYPDRGLKLGRDAVERARTLAHPFSLARALLFVSFLLQMRREPQAVLETTDASVALCTEHGFPFWMAYAVVLRGWSLAQSGIADERIENILEGLNAHAAGGTDLTRPYVLSLLAEAHVAGGHFEQALVAASEALGFLEKNGERHHEAELHRLRGQILVMSGRTTEEVEPHFRRAIAIARRQSAKWPELRATTSLARLLDKEGRPAEARRMLGEIYGWFTEGFDTADLRGAKARRTVVRFCRR